MPQQNPKSLQPEEPDVKLEVILQRCKDKIENVRSTLSYGVDLEIVNAKTISTYKSELRLVIGDIEGLKKINITYFVPSPQTLERKVKDAIDRLSTASDVLKKANTVEKRRRYFYPSLRECEQFLNEARDQFKNLRP